MKTKSVVPFVKKDYPSAAVSKCGNEYVVRADGLYLGKGKSKKAAWKAAYNNFVR